MEHSVALGRLPDGVRFPADLAEHIRYDEGKRRLIYRGFMRKREYDRLAALSPDLAYVEALQELFVEATFEPEQASKTSGRRMLIPLAAAAGLVLVLATLYFAH